MDDASRVPADFATKDTGRKDRQDTARPRNEAFQQEETLLANSVRHGELPSTDPDLPAEYPAPRNMPDYRGMSDTSPQAADTSAAEMPDSDIEQQITRQLAERGLESRSAILLEASLYIEDKYREIGIIADQGRPELIFGDKEWLSFLDARNFAGADNNPCLGPDGELTVSFIQEVHKRLMSRFDLEKAGQFRRTEDLRWGDYEVPMMWGNPWVPLTTEQAAAIEENPLLTHVPPFDPGEYGVVIALQVPGEGGPTVLRILDLPLTESERVAIDNDPLTAYVAGDHVPDYVCKSGCILYPTSAGPEWLEEQMESAVGWFNDAIRKPGCDVYEVAAELQNKLISMHPFFDYNGRTSRIVMNWVLERHGLPPSAIGEFDNDLLMSKTDWAKEVQAGSIRHSEWAANLERLGDGADPVKVFELELEKEGYGYLVDGSSDPFVPGDIHYGPKYLRQLLEVRQERKNKVVRTLSAVLRQMYKDGESPDLTEKVVTMREAVDVLSDAIHTDLHSGVPLEDIQKKYGISSQAVWQVYHEKALQAVAALRRQGG